MVNLNEVMCMFLSFLCGIVISRLVRNKYILPLVAIGIGTLIGFLGAIGVLGVVYPFFIAESGFAYEMADFTLSFMTPQIRIYSFSSEWMSTAMPLMPIVVAILVITSVVSVLVGQLAGRRWFGRKSMT